MSSGISVASTLASSNTPKGISNQLNSPLNYNSPPKAQNSAVFPETEKKVIRKQSISDYQLIKEVGRGSYGKIILASNKKTKQLVAIKIMDKFFLDSLNKTSEAIVEREMLLKYLSHNNIIKLRSTFQNSQKLFFVTDYMEKGSLKDFLLQNGPLSPKEAKPFLQDLLSVLEYFEEKNVVHRDLKPENILLDKNSSLKLIDFATATFSGKEYDLKKRKFVEREKYEDLVGTVKYMAPEMIRGEVKNDKSLDIWSLGVIIYELLHGETPFKGESDEEIMQSITQGKFELNQKLPEDAKDLILHLLNYDQEKRLGINSISEIKNHRFFSPEESFDELAEVNTLCSTRCVSDDFSVYNKENEIEIIDNFYQEEHKDDIIYEGCMNYETKVLFFTKSKICNLVLKQKKLFVDEEIEIDLEKINRGDVYLREHNNKSYVIIKDDKKTYHFSSAKTECQNWFDKLSEQISA